MMKTLVTRLIPAIHAQHCALVARLIPHLAWRHSGLGMLQSYVQEGERTELRVHIWHPSLRRAGIEASGLLHDHRFDLHSAVLVGGVHQVEYELTPCAPDQERFQLHEVVHARAAAGGKHAPNDGLVKALPIAYDVRTKSVIVPEGSQYMFPKREFHGTYPTAELTITLMTKTDQEDAPARILAPYGKEVVHAFADPLPSEEWRPILDVAVAALTARWKKL